MNNEHKLLISFAVPCYNVAGYIDHCVESILAGTQGYHDRIEIILVDDGSTSDETPQHIDSWQREHPGIIKAIHQDNGGHGDAVNTGLRHAAGLYFKVVDADDWLDEQSMKQIMEFLLHQASPVDLVIANYVYEKVFEGKRTAIRYKGTLPEGEVFGWDAARKFKPYQYLLMHSVMYKTSILHDCKLELPKHTFYVDNIFVYTPLPFVTTICYINVDLYRYLVGREGQSVNEKTMVSRIDQQLRINRIMIDEYVLDRDVENSHLRAYMINYLTMMMVISSVFLLLSKHTDADEERSALWSYLKERNPGVYPRIRHSFLGFGVTLKGRVGHALTILGYRLAQKLFKFN